MISSIAVVVHGRLASENETHGFGGVSSRPKSTGEEVLLPTSLHSARAHHRDLTHAQWETLKLLPRRNK